MKNEGNESSAARRVVYVPGCNEPCSGKEIVKQFRRGMHERISDGIPYSQRGGDTNATL